MKSAIIILLFCVVGYSIAFSKYGLWCYHICKTSQLCSNSLHLPCFKYTDFEEALNKTGIRTLDSENELLNNCVEMYFETERTRGGTYIYKWLNCEPVEQAWASVIASELSGKLPMENVSVEECDPEESLLKVIEPGRRCNCNEKKPGSCGRAVLGVVLFSLLLFAVILFLAKCVLYVQEAV